MVAILNGQHASDDDEDRHITVFPPNSFGNNMPIFVTHLDANVSIGPVGCVVLHFDGIFKDSENAESLMRSALKFVQKERYHGFSLLWEAIYSRPTLDKCSVKDYPGFFCIPNCESVCLDENFHLAKLIYEEIVKDHPFLYRDKSKYCNPTDESDEEDDEHLRSALELIEVEDSPKSSTSD